MQPIITSSCLWGLVLCGGAWATDATTLVSVASDGTAAVADVGEATLSADGRWVVFATNDDSLLAADTNGNWDVFAHDRQTGVTRRLSVRSNGEQALGASRKPAVSANGRWVVFESTAPNLVNSDTNGLADIYLHDRDTDVDGLYDEAGAISTVRVSVATAGQTNGPSTAPAISADGRAVAYVSTATNLVAGFGGGAGADVFVWDRDHDGDGVFSNATAVTVHVSVGDAGQHGDHFETRPALSGDGRFVVFQSPSTNLVGDDTNGSYTDVFLRDRDPDADGLFDEPGATTSLVSRASDGTVADRGAQSAVISADGRWIAFQSTATNLVGAGDATAPSVWRVFLRDRVEGVTRLAVAAAGHLRDPALSADGRFVAFDSTSSDLVPFDMGQLDAFRLDRDVDADGVFDEPGQTAVERLSVGTQGSPADGPSRLPVLTGDGSEAVFLSRAENLEPEGTAGPAGIERVYVRGDAPPGAGDPGGWFDIDMGGVQGFAGVPRIGGDGSLQGDDDLVLTITEARPLAFTVLFAGLTRVDAPLLGGVLVPDPLVQCYFHVEADKTLTIEATWPVELADVGTEMFYQAWIQDPAADGGWSATDAIFCRVP